jgi:Na+/H+ antiporter NhaC
MAHALNPDPLFMSVNIGAVLTGAIFGDHCSPISDTTILSSMGASCDHIDHTRTQIFYALTIALLAILIGHLPVNLGVPGWLILLLGAVFVFFLPRIIGKPVDKEMIE